MFTKKVNFIFAFGLTLSTCHNVGNVVFGSLNKYHMSALKAGVLSLLATLWLPSKRKTAETQ